MRRAATPPSWTATLPSRRTSRPRWLPRSKPIGRIDVLVNNAGVVDDAPFLDLPLEELDRVLSINLRGAFLMAQAVARQMVKQGRARAVRPPAPSST